jgi:FSR family fosmidomycin resistance protein-like MFS transporter
MLSLLRNRTLLGFSLAHFCVDLCAGALAVFVVYYAQALELSIAQSGFVLGAFTLVSSLTQPLFGYLSDRYGGRWQSTLGLLCIAVFLGLTGYATSYEMLLALACVAGVGSALFHPHGASGARKADAVRKTSAMSVFMLGGNVGYAIGPSLAAAAMSRLGAHGSLAVLGLGLIFAPFVYASSRPSVVQTNAAAQAAANKGFGRAALLLLMVVMLFRAWASAAATSFTPTFFPKVAGFSVESASLLSTVYLIALAMGGMFGGILADRFGGLRVMIVAMCLFGPLTALMFWLSGPASFWVAPLAGFAAGASWPPLVVMAQDALPRHSGVASGLTLGFAFAMGGIGVSVTGWLAEPTMLGLSTVMPLLGVLPLLAAAFGSQLGRAISRPAAA